MTFRSIAVAALVTSLFSPALAFNFVQGIPERSGLKDISNLRIVDKLFDAFVFHDASDPDLYINGVSLSPGTTWDPGITMSDGSSGGYFGDYQIGTAITGTTNHSLRFAQVDGVDASVANGQYDFSVDILGGGDSSAQGVLATFGYTLDVHDRFNPTVTLNAIAPVAIGGTTSMSYTAVNGTGSEITLNGLWVGGESTFYGVVPFSFASNYFYGQVAPGGSVTSDHMVWSPDLGTPVGTYSVVAGIIGGFHDGEYHFVNSSNDQSFDVVPEPASWTVLSLGILIARRRRMA